MTKPSLLVLAAGMGSRYGGLKQLDPVGPGGETLLDYSVYDAIRAGFDRVVFLIRRDIEKEFRSQIGTRYEGRIAVDYAFQQLDQLPAGHKPPAGRSKPWGTAHAIWCARNVITGPFAAINADDFYGQAAYRQLGSLLQSAAPDARPARFVMAGYRLDKTLSEHGTVARGICKVGPDGLLREIEEITDIARREDGRIACGDRVLADDTPVSMNFWGFTPQVFSFLEKSLTTFLDRSGTSEKAEHYIPSAVAEMIADARATVRVESTDSDWFGVTYRDDKPRVVESIRRLVRQGEYPEKI
ncbi:MAG: nucleotidyltransferase [Chthoniobacterales bacterium]|nr:nucleotidyltransferase [Chthoniobacterales bacterium]